MVPVQRWFHRTLSMVSPKLSSVACRRSSAAIDSLDGRDQPHRMEDAYRSGAPTKRRYRGCDSLAWRTRPGRFALKDGGQLVEVDRAGGAPEELDHLHQHQ